MLNRIFIIFQKEVLDNVRDRRALTSTLVGTLIGPALMLLLFFVIGQSAEEQAEKTLQLPVIGAEFAPNLIDYLVQNNVEILPPPEDAEEQVRVGDYDVVLIISETFGEDLQAGVPASVRMVIDDSRQSSSVAIRRVEGLVNQYSRTIASLRLLARGVSPTVLNPIAIRTVDVATPQSSVAQLLNMMPYFLIFSVFIGGMHLAIDTTAGERERGSLEPLLINPVPRSEFVLGKMSATALFTLISVIGTLLAFMIMLQLVSLESLIGTRISLSPVTMFGIFLIVVPMIGLASAIQTIIAAFSKTYREAQGYLSFLPLVPALPGMFLAFLPVKANIWMMLIPTFGQQLLINQLLRQEPLSGLNVLVSVAVTLLITLILIWVAIRLYQREKILFGR